jgi:hypothetical protein
MLGYAGKYVVQTTYKVEIWKLRILQLEVYIDYNSNH